MLKSLYSLDFLGLHRAVKEHEVENRFISRLQAFLLELGRDICGLRLQRCALSSFSSNCIRGTIHLRMWFSQVYDNFSHAISAPLFQ